MKQIGIIGLGKMGSSLALNAKDKGMKVVGKTLSPRPQLTRKGIVVVQSYKKFVDNLKPPRIIYLSLPAGKIVDDVILELIPYLSRGDVIMDGGNSYWRDSIRRAKELSEKSIYFLDCGTSGGVSGARNGACFMVGGDLAGIRKAAPILRKLAVPQGFVHTGPSGSGHYAKLVHNGIEFGMLQAIGEGLSLLENGEFDYDLTKVLNNWAHGSVIRSWLIELLRDGLAKEDLKGVPSHIEDTGEVNWLIADALLQETPIPVISQSVMELFKSRDNKKYAYKAISVMRHGFGGHPYGRNKYIRKERKNSRITKI